MSSTKQSCNPLLSASARKNHSLENNSIRCLSEFSNKIKDENEERCNIKCYRLFSFSKPFRVIITVDCLYLIVLTSPYCLCMFCSSRSVFIARQLTRDIDIGILSVRLSVCLSVRDTLVLYENGLTYRHSFSTVR